MPRQRRAGERAPLLSGQLSSDSSEGDIGVGASSQVDIRSSVESNSPLRGHSTASAQPRRAAVAGRLHGAGESTFRPGERSTYGSSSSAISIGGRGRRPSVSALPVGAINESEAGDDRDDPAERHEIGGRSLVGSLSEGLSRLGEALGETVPAPPDLPADYMWELPSVQTQHSQRLQRRAMRTKFDRRRLRFYGAVGLAVDQDQLYNRTRELQDADEDALSQGVYQGAVGVASMRPPPQGWSGTDTEYDYSTDASANSLATLPYGRGKDVDYDSEDGEDDLVDILVPGGSAGMFPTMFNLANTAIGAGTLAIPFAISQAGLALGVIVLVVCGIMAAFSSNLLMVSAEYAGGSSYKDLAVSAFGRWGARTVEASLVLLTYGTLCAYLGVFYLIGRACPRPGRSESFGVPVPNTRFWFQSHRFKLGAPHCSLYRRHESRVVSGWKIRTWTLDCRRNIAAEHAEEAHGLAVHECYSDFVALVPCCHGHS
jgi:Transmembrane amino acid transporter protein